MVVDCTLRLCEHLTEQFRIPGQVRVSMSDRTCERSGRTEPRPSRVPPNLPNHVPIPDFQVLVQALQRQRFASFREQN